MAMNGRQGNATRSLDTSDAYANPSTHPAFAQLADALPSIVWICDSSGRAEFFNARWYELTGETFEQVKDFGWAEVLHPEDRARVLVQWDSAVKNPAPYEVELRYRMADGTFRWHQVKAMPVHKESGEIDHWFGISTDIEKQHASEEASVAMTQAIVETAVDGIITIDERGTVESCNPDAERMFGYHASELLGTNFETLLPASDRSQQEGCGSRDVFAGENNLIGVGREVVGQRKDGTTFPMELAVSEVRMRGRRIFTGIVRDISNRRRLERELRGQTRVLERVANGDMLPDVLRTLVEVAEETRPDMIGSVLLLDQQAGCLRHGASIRLPDFYREAIDGAKIGPDVGSCGTAAFTGQRVIAENIANHPSWGNFREVAELAGLRACWSEPIISSSGRVLGTFAMYYREPQAPDEKDLEFVANSAKLAALAIQRIQSDESLRQMSTIVDSTDEAIIMESTDGVIESWNQGAERIYGFLAAEAIGKSISILNPADLGDERSEIIQRLRRSERVERFRTIRLTKDRRKIHVSLTISPVRNSEGEITHFVSVQNDVTERVVTSMAFERQNAVYEAIVNSIPEAMVKAGSDRRLVYVNPAAGRMFGYEPSELIGQSASVLYANQTDYEHQGRTRFHKNAADQHYEVVEIDWRRKNGDCFPGELVGTVIQGHADQPIGYLALIRDVTDRKRAEATIVESQRQLSTLIGNLSGAAFRCLIDDDWTMEFISEGCLELTGYSVAEIVNSKPTWTQLMHPDDCESTRETVLKSLAERKRYQTEYRIRHRNGDERWVWEQGQAIFVDDRPVAIEGFVTDVTKQRQTEDALRDREQQYRTVVATAGSIVILISRENRILEWNSAAEQLLGYVREEVLGKNPFEFLIDVDLRDDALAIAEAVNAGHQKKAFELPLLARDGSQRVLLWNAAPMTEGNNLVVGYYAVGQDITDLKTAQDQLVQSERLAAIGQMLSATAHESRNALQRIQVSLDLLDFEISEGSEARVDLDRIAGAKDDLLQLFEDQRSYAAPIKLGCSMCNLSEVWRQAWENLDASRRNRQAIFSEAVNGANLNCSIDAFRVEQVFRNLFENALSACSDPVELEVSCSNTDIDGTPGVCVCVRDNGPGLTIEQKERIFEAFFTTKTKGTGLGMAIAKRTIEAHRGTIVARNSDRGGAEFLITLPSSQ